VKPLTLRDIAPRALYAELRPAYRAEIIALKRHRRVAVGDRVTVVFENRETLRFQVQEMCRVERLDDPAAVQHEVDVYNELIPPQNGLSATLFIEIPDLDRIKAELNRLVGIDEHVALHVGDERVPAHFDKKQMEEDRISAVQYIRFQLDAEQAAAIGDHGIPVRLAIDHPNYRYETLLAEPTRASLATDLRGDASSLLPEEHLAGGVAAGVELVEEAGRIRTLRVAAGHWVVEPLEPAPLQLADPDPELALELLRAAETLAAAVVSESQATPRIALDLAGDRPRWHILAG
jgi:hypothetical protein